MVINGNVQKKGDCWRANAQTLDVWTEADSPSDAINNLVEKINDIEHSTAYKRNSIIHTESDGWEFILSTDLDGDDDDDLTLYMATRIIN